MVVEFDPTIYNKMIRELGSYSSLIPFGEPEIFSEGVALRNKAVSELRKKYPTASKGALDFMVSYELNEFASDPLHPEYEQEARKLIAS